MKGNYKTSSAVQGTSVEHFNENEMNCMYDVFNGHLFTDEPWFPYSIQLLINLQSSIEDCMEDKWHVSIADMCAKIESMTDEEARELVNDIRSFWASK